MHLEVDIESIVNEYSPLYGIIHDHLLLLANNLLGNNVHYHPKKIWGVVDITIQEFSLPSKETGK